MARWLAVFLIALTACNASGPTVTTTPLGVEAASPLALGFLADLEVTIDEIHLARDAAVRCAAARGVEVEATVTEEPDGTVELSYQVEAALSQVVDRCFTANVGPLMDFRAWLWDGLAPEAALERALRGR
ncbi:MAG: hypothetical protein H0T94_01840 [Acidimicrobiia bacterium]|nr:hypothetical protein [Acidimicrobiia bacterium]